MKAVTLVRKTTGFKGEKHPNEYQDSKAAVFIGEGGDIRSQ